MEKITMIAEIAVRKRTVLMLFSLMFFFERKNFLNGCCGFLLRRGFQSSLSTSLSVFFNPYNFVVRS